MNENKNNLDNNILITGGAGYIGSCLALYLKKKYRITILDKKKSKNLMIYKSKGNWLSDSQVVAVTQGLGKNLKFINSQTTC